MIDEFLQEFSYSTSGPAMASGGLVATASSGVSQGKMGPQIREFLKSLDDQVNFKKIKKLF